MNLDFFKMDFWPPPPQIFFLKNHEYNIFKLYDPFLWMGLTVSRLHIQYKEAVYFLPLGPKMSTDSFDLPRKDERFI